MDTRVQWRDYGARPENLPRATMAIEDHVHQLQGTLSGAETRSIYTSACTVVELLAVDSSACIYLYDMAAELGLGQLARAVQKQGGKTEVIEMQTRNGAGSILLGRLSGQTSVQTESSPITAFTNVDGLVHMMPCLLSLNRCSSSGQRLVLQVSNTAIRTDSFELVADYSRIFPALPSLPSSIAMIFSSGAQETVDVAKISYEARDFHVIHVFDHIGTAKEETRITVPPQSTNTESNALEDTLEQAGYKNFDYFGPENPSIVLVSLNSALCEMMKALILPKFHLGIISVRVLRPWNAQKFQACVPSSTERLIVVDEVEQEDSGLNYLHGEVFSSLFHPLGVGPLVESLKVVFNQTHAYFNDISILSSRLVSLGIPSSSLGALSVPGKKLILFSSASSGLAKLGSTVVSTFNKSRSVATRRLTEFDFLSKPEGVVLDRLLISPAPVAEDHLWNDTALRILMPPGNTAQYADFTIITDQNLLKTHDVLGASGSGSLVLLFTSWTAEEICLNASQQVIESIVKRKLRVFIINTRAILAGTSMPHKDTLEIVLAYMSALRLYFGEMGKAQLVQSLAKSTFGDIPEPTLQELSAAVWQGMDEIYLEEEILAQEDRSEHLNHFLCTSASPRHTADLKADQTTTRLDSWNEAAKHLLFHEAYTCGDQDSKKNSDLRPDVQEKTFLITTTVNRRLTPASYNRNVFHLEFDTSGTGLKYAIGEALGVYGWNDADEVLEFCKWYGADPNQILTLPVPESGGIKKLSRTVFQALQQQVDIFGRPPKSFYGSLAEHATAREDRMALLFIAAPEGGATFKKMGEKDTVTFADVLQHFASARPPIEILAELIGDIKPRHYSIASAMAAVGDRVDLLVVTVDWVTPSGSPRYGQCTRYLAGLKIGQKVTVSIKPSVMKLPPNDMQPIIMAGLGTGAAPFRAFMQYRALLMSQNKPAGPLVYYFGSRHRAEEYLYGEEIEAYIEASVITHSGLAFSRDTDKKVYIQHKMGEDADMLVKMLKREEGVFYLCGPTWPVPDVYETLVKALVRHEGAGTEEAGEYLEGLKEQERYVLEVY